MRVRQGELRFRTWGGKREGAGQKPNGEVALVSHLRRASLASRFPVHVTMTVREGLPGLRGRDERRAGKVFADRYHDRILKTPRGGDDTG